jgi:hypothetical protein
MFKFDDPSSQMDNFGTTQPFAELIGSFHVWLPNRMTAMWFSATTKQAKVLISRVGRYS